MRDTVYSLASWVEPTLLWYFILINTIYGLLLVLGAFGFYSRYRELKIEDLTPILQSESLPEIAFLIPAYNESGNILANIYNILDLSYRYKKIVVINDGSSDDTMSVLTKALELIAIPQFFAETLPTQKIRSLYRSKLHPSVIIIDKEHGKKYDALNAGINCIDSPFFITLDADTFLDSGTFEALVRPILTYPETVAAGASVRIRNGCTLSYNRMATTNFPSNYLPAMQSLEYLRAFLARQGWNYINGNFIISGAFAIFPRSLVIKAGGICPSVAEDMEIIVRLHRVMKESDTPYRIFYIPDPLAWTEGPSTLQKLGKQRTKWHFGLLETLWYHKKICFNPRYGLFGFFVYPFWLIGEALEPVVEIFAWGWVTLTLFLGLLHLPFFLLFVGSSLLLTFLYSIFCLFVEDLTWGKFSSVKSMISLTLYSALENLGYRQLTVWWRLRAFGQFFQEFGKICADGKMVRKLVSACLIKRPLETQFLELPKE